MSQSGAVSQPSPGSQQDPLKQAAIVIRRQEARIALLEHAERERNEPIAVVGIGCRFPGGASSPEAFWELLEAGRDAVQPLAQRWALVGAQPRENVPSWAGLLTEAVDRFDAAFFGISPREARALDPQHRLLLEVAWEAFEDAGIPPRSLEGSRTGVFVGAISTDYLRIAERRPDDELDAYTMTGNLLSIAAGRLSYTLGLQGPCLTLDTACSSSLVTAHLACRSLHARECDVALAGGVNVILSPEGMAATTRLHALSPDGRCWTFDASANGYVRGEGCGLVVLKRLSDAERDGDRIWALVRGSAVNQDGRSTGLTAPNVLAQQALLRDALRSGRVEAGAIGYVETHGTGTSLGDPIEVEALRAVVGQERPDGSRCLLGALKTNIGHLEGAAGVAGLIKAALSLHHERIPKNLNFRTLNPRIRLEETALALATEPVPWPRTDQPRFAGVSSFGLSGTNVHVVLEEAPQLKLRREAPERSAELVVLSAKSASALDAQAKRLRQHLDAHPSLGLSDVAFSLATTRSPMDHRLAVTATSRDALRAALDAAAEGQTPVGAARGRLAGGRSPKVVFVFPGQGSQWLGMGRQLLTQEPVFRATLEECEGAIRAEAGWSLLAELGADEATSRLGRIDVVQPVLFALEVALASLWRSWGVTPDAVVGHSMGEVAAAHVAGALSLPDAVSIICRRSRLLRRISGQGEMAVVELSLGEAEAALVGYEARLGVAVSNSPRSTVLSGEPAALGEVLAALEAKGVFCRRVKVDVASHSPQVDPLRDELLSALSALQPQKTMVPMCSTVTGAFVAGQSLVADYWADNVRRPVRFADVVHTLLKNGHGLFVEMSPHPILTTSVEELRRAEERDGVTVGSLRRGQPERATMLEALGALWALGHPVAWDQLSPAGSQRVPLPTYPWQQERYWLERSPPSSRGDAEGAGFASSRHPFLSRHLRGAEPDSAAYWEGEISLERFPYLADHRVGHVVVLPGTAYLEMVLEAAEDLFGQGPIELTDVRFLRVLFVPAQAEQLVKVSFLSMDPTGTEFRIHSRSATRNEDAWTLHTVGRVARIAEGSATPELRPAPDAPPEALDPTTFYERLGAGGVQYGPRFRAVRELRHGGRDLFGRVALSDVDANEAGRYRFHPALLDACLHILSAPLALAADAPGGSAFVFKQAARIRVLQHPGAAALSSVTLRDDPGNHGPQIVGDARILSARGDVVAEAWGVEAHLLDQRRRTSSPDNLSSWLYEITWQEVVSPATWPEAGQGTWLVIEPDGAFDPRVLEGLPGARRVRVQPSTGFMRHSPERYSANLESPTEFGLLLEAMRADPGDPLRGIVHLGALVEGAESAVSPSDLSTAAQRLCMSVVYLLRALDDSSWTEPPKLWLVTRGSQRVCDVDHVHGLIGAPLWGLGKSIAAEHAAFWGGLIDLDPTADTARDAEALQWTAQTAHAVEDHLASRSGAMYASRLARHRIQTTASSVPFRPDVSYLITGGLGELGLGVARWMVERGARHVILLGRRGLPAREEWRDFAPETQIGRRISAVLALERLGASVTAVQVDIADEGATRKFVDAHDRASRPPIDGIIHAAGAVVPRLLVETDAETLAAQFAPKVQGSCVLDRLFSERELTFLVYFSSGSSILPSPRIGAYAAANSFMDALAHHRRAGGRAATSVNWGFWQAGMAAREVSTEAIPKGMRSFAQQHGLDLLGQLMCEAPAQVAVMPMDWAEWFEYRAETRGSPMLLGLREGVDAEATPAASSMDRGDLRSRLLAVTSKDREQVLLEHVVEQVSTVLRLPSEQFDVREAFGSMGLDSLMAMEVRNRFESSVGVTLSVTMLWNYPTAESLMPYLLERMGLDASEPPAPEGGIPEEVERGASIRDEVAKISDADAERLLMEELAGWAGEERG